MNTITVAGRIGREPELRHTQSGDPVLSFGVADDQRDKTTIWWSCSLWGRRAEALQQYLHKGGHVTVVGPVTRREYTDRDGQTRVSLDIRVSEIALQGGKPTAGTGADPAPYQANPKPQASPAPAAGDPFGDMDSDIP